MSLQLGDTAPDFTQNSTEGLIHFYGWAANSWVVLFSHPKDFTPVCTTELGAVAKLKKAFDERAVKVVGLSIDPVNHHREWSKDIEVTQGAKLNFPLLADSNRVVSNLYGMIHGKANNRLTARSVFVIDPDKRIRLIMIYPASTGRNFDEILRVIDSLQLTDNYQVVTPVNWKRGEDVTIVPALQDPAEIKQRFPRGYRALISYLRYTPDPTGSQR